jgi:excisionase family DNA binding protein
MTAPSDACEWLTVPEAVRILPISRTTLYDAIKAGLVPAVRFGRAVRLTTATVTALTQTGIPPIHQEQP